MRPHGGRHPPPTPSRSVIWGSDGDVCHGASIAISLVVANKSQINRNVLLKPPNSRRELQHVSRKPCPQCRRGSRQCGIIGRRLQRDFRGGAGGYVGTARRVLPH